MIIPQLLTWGSAILGFTSALNPGDKELSDAKNTLDTLGSAYNVLSTTSVSASAGRAIIAPMALFEQSLTHQDFMTDLMTVVNMRDIRDALTHINFQSKIDGVKIGTFVDSINPNRQSGFLGYEYLQGMEAFTPPKGSVLEKLANKENAEKDNGKDDKGQPEKLGDAKEFQSMTEYTPLAVGKTVNAQVNQNGKPVFFPLTFRQVPIPSTTANLELIFSATKKEEGWAIRVKDWKFGTITTPELLCGVDEIRNEFKIRTQDMTGYYAEANARETRNRVESIRTGRISMNTCANTVILTKDTADRIEIENGVSFSNSGIGKIRKVLNANTIVICDIQNGIFKFFSMSSNLVETFTASQIKQKAKKEDAGTLEGLIKILNGR